MDRRPTFRRRWLLLVDGLLLCLILAVGIWSWPQQDGPISGYPELEIPWWGTVEDLLLMGPDAGWWARSTQALAEGRLHQVDTHRMPTWQILVAAAMQIEPNVVRAGHLVNRLLLLVAGLFVYLLGRAGGGRGVGLGAAVMVILAWELVFKSLQYSADIAVVAFVPFTLYMAYWASRRKAIAPLAGVVAGFAMLSHFTMIPYALPGLALMLMRWRGSLLYRMMAAGGFLLGGLLVLSGIASFYPLPSFQHLGSVFSEGIVHGLDQGSYSVQGPGVAGALGKIFEGLYEGIPASMAAIVKGLGVNWCPWVLALVLPWIGVLGLGLHHPPEERRRRKNARWLLNTSDGAMGLALLFCLAPLPFLMAAESPDRYAMNLLPVAMLLFVRGLASVCAGLEALIRIWFKQRWPRGVLVMVMGCLMAGAAVSRRQPLQDSSSAPPWGMTYLTVGRALAKAFPPGIFVASPLQESLIYSGHRFCPELHCPVGDSPEAFQRCLQMMNRDCKSKGSIPYVATDTIPNDPRRPARIRMDAWILSRHTPIQTVEGKGYRVHFLKIPWP